VIVMVLGESSRFDRWSLNGYARDTNPLLSQEANLVALQDLITSVSATRLSVPVIISRKPAMQSLKDGFSEKSFLTAFKEAGYKTFWLSNQISFGKFDTPVSVFAKEADRVEFLNLGGFTDNSNYDEVLFGPLRHARGRSGAEEADRAAHAGQPLELRAPLSGSSTSGSRRCTASTSRSDRHRDQAAAEQQLRQFDPVHGLVPGPVIGNEGRTAGGDAVRGRPRPDPVRRRLPPGLPRPQHQYEFHVPAFAWYSDAYGARFPDKVAQLRATARRRWRPRTCSIPCSTWATSAIRASARPQLRQRAASSSTSATSTAMAGPTTTTPRIKGDCHEVIAKGKPLPRIRDTSHQDTVVTAPPGQKTKRRAL
jgi:hypothetical protein